VVLANSVADFSAIQGFKGWYYGYYSAPFNSASFQLLSQYGPDGDFTGSPTMWHLQLGSGGFYTALGQSVAHPNGPTSGGGRQNVGHWACRRWISNRSGAVRISGSLSKADVQSCGGCDGVRGRIIVGGIEVWNQFLAQFDSTGYTFNLTQTVSAGTTIDFALDGVGNDGRDLSNFTATIRGGDCNANGIPDSCDIASATSQDCNSNDIPDECESQADCNNNGIRDICEFVDCNSNGVLDSCDIAAGESDINHDGIPDSCVFPLVCERVKPCGNFFLTPDDAPDRLRVFSRTGSSITALTSLSDIGGPLSCDADGNIMVPDWNNNQVFVISPTGTLVRMINGAAPAVRPPQQSRRPRYCDLQLSER
jgi:hypothetical protein